MEGNTLRAVLDDLIKKKPCYIKVHDRDWNAFKNVLKDYGMAVPFSDSMKNSILAYFDQHYHIIIQRFDDCYELPLNLRFKGFRR